MSKGIKRFLALVLLAAAGLGASGVRENAETILISGGTVIDGTGAARRVADVRIAGDRIKEIGELKPLPKERVIDAKGLIIAPGFIDIHNHSERGFEKDPIARSQILQGITTLAIGPDGGSPWPIAEYLDWCVERRLAVNVLTFVGHATVRRRVMRENFNRTAAPDEISRMIRLVEQGMQEGAVGLSTGLEYDVGHPSTTEELIALALAAAKYNGIYMSHVRDEADDAINAFKEAIRIGREAKLPVQISHIKLGTVSVWNKAGEVAALINHARRDGVDVTADCYPYTAWASTIKVLVPSRKHDDPIAVKKGLDDVGGGANVRIASCPARPEYEGKTLDEIGARVGKTAVEVYIQIVKEGGANVICQSMIESDIETFYRQPWVMAASDGGIGMRHPRGAGTFPRILGVYVREKQWLTLEQAIHKMSAIPAARLRVNDRGKILAGMKADLVVFDAEHVKDLSTMTSPSLEPVGVRHVLVNGVQVVTMGQVTGERPGAVLRRGVK
jgi:N-acyl-D-amino-acid deacylase